MAAAVAAAFLPPALVLALLVSKGTVSPVWGFSGIFVGAVLGAWSIVSLARFWAGRAERIGQVAAALQSQSPPPHIIPDERDAMALAERRLLDPAHKATDE